MIGSPMTIDARLKQALSRWRAGDRPGAAAVCHEASRTNPKDPRPFGLLGFMALDSGDYKNARAHYGEAVKRAPQSPNLLNSYGISLSYCGAFEDAAAQYRRAITHDPNFVPAYFHLAQIEKSKPGDPVVDKLERLKQIHAQNNTHLSLIGFTLGKIYDDLGDYDRAFANYAEGNQHVGARYDIAETRAFFEETKQVFDSALMGRLSEAGSTSEKPVFIIGMPRSGSSLVEEILARHDKIVGLGERGELSYVIDAIASTHATTSGYPGAITHLAESEVAAYAAQYLSPLEELAPDAARLIDKNLLNFQAAGLIRLLFPNAPILHTRRDPVDTCLSCYFQRFDQAHEFSFNLTDLGHHYTAYLDLMTHWERVAPGAIQTVDYETLVNESARETDRIFRLIGIDAPSEATTSSPAERDIATSSVWQARQPVYKTSVSRWKNYERHLAPLFDALDAAGVP